MMRRLAVILLTTFGLGMPAAMAQTGNPNHDFIVNLSQAVQRGEMLRLIRNEGLAACSDVTTVFHAGFDPARNAFWDARCREGTMVRLRFAPLRWNKPSMLVCGAQAAPPDSGPCFRPVAEGLALAAQPPQPAGAQVAAQCRAACTANQATGLVEACTQRCITGGGVAVGRQVADTMPPGTRFGVIFTTDTPLGAFGFGNGDTDRLAVNIAAARACQNQAGRTECKFRQELINTCAALVQGVVRHPQAMVITSDISTFMVTRIAIGTGATVTAAQDQAMAACRTAAGSATCRIVASGC